MKITKKQLKKIIKEAGGNPWIDSYLDWVKSNGHITPAASSVIASYLISKGIESLGHMRILGDAFGVSVEDIEREWNRQFDEQGGFTYGESTMKITKNQLKRIIKEELFLLRFILLIIFENSENFILLEVASYKTQICS